jgi:16S rRNA (guanine527-N7)-methyltransferase
MDSIQLNFQSTLHLKYINLSEQQLTQFELYYRELISWNEKMNLTGITDREQVYVKHFYDSLSVSFFLPMTDINNIADIGSGAGFPSIPLKIVYPHLKVTIVDSLNKRIQFLNHLVTCLDLSGVRCVHGRAEDTARIPEHRDRYELVTARAVAKLAVLNEFCLPFTAVNGTFVAMKGSEIDQELKESAFSLRELKGKYIHTEHFELPDGENASRNLVFVRKLSTTPKMYPRKAGIPLKLPLL